MLRTPSCQCSWMALVALTLASIASGQVTAIDPCVPNATRSVERAPEGLSATDWSTIRTAYEASRHALVAVEDGYQARNPGQAWTTRFDGRGFVAVPDVGGWSWGLELVHYGFAGHERGVATPTNVGAAGQRLAYEWDATLTEWYVNDTRGLEHGYTVRARPTDGEGPLRFTLTVRGELCPEVQNEGRDVRFVNADGEAILNYAGLAVLDADGSIVPARFEAVPGGLLMTIDEAGARYPLTIDPIAQRAYLKASNTEAGDNFGSSVAISGDTVVIGAPAESSYATGVNGDEGNNDARYSGAAYVFVRSSGTWSQQAYLKASNTGVEDLFGSSVAISGDTVVVGAYFEDSNATGVDGDQSNDDAESSGAAYVFVRTGDMWSQQAYLKASNTGAHDLFGTSVAVAGNTVVVGAHGEDSNATGVNGDQANNGAFDSGAVYVFVRSGAAWSQQAYLKASNTDFQDSFAISVATSDDTVVVGAYLESSSATGVNGDDGNNAASGAGAAYVFVRSGTAWSQQAYLKASNTGLGDLFGASVAVSGDTVIVGAFDEDSSATGVNGDQTSNNAFNSGAAYVFVRTGAAWSQQAYLKASNTGVVDVFGSSVAVSGNTALIGARNEDSSSTGSNGNQANNDAGNSGAAYMFVRHNTMWVQEAYLKASNAEAGDWFGWSVAVSSDTMVVGALREDGNSTGVDGDGGSNDAADSGAAYILSFSLAGDLDDDGDVDGADLGLLLGAWSGSGGDVNGDGITDDADLRALLGAWTG